jgi:hypothetical protein
MLKAKSVSELHSGSVCRSLGNYSGNGMEIVEKDWVKEDQKNRRISREWRL